MRITGAHQTGRGLSCRLALAGATAHRVGDFEATGRIHAWPAPEIGLRVKHFRRMSRYPVA